MMATFRGVLERVDIGAGGWSLRMKGGKRVDLYGDVPAALEGKQVVVEGDKADAGFLMGGGGGVEVARIHAG